MHQTQDTSTFLQAVLSDQFGPYGNFKATTEVINGTFDIDTNLDVYTQKLLRQCACKETDTKEIYERSMDMFKSSWLKMKEQTSSNGDLHFGRCKAGVQNLTNLMVHYVVAEILFRTGYTLKSWMNATNVILLKSKGSYDVNELRTIVLYEADMNHNNKFFERSFMQHTVGDKSIVKEQYNVPGKMKNTINCWEGVANTTDIYILWS